MKRMDEHLLNNYAAEAKRDGKLSAGKVENLLHEVWRARHEAEVLRQNLGKAKEDVARLQKALKESMSDPKSMMQAK